MSLYSDKIIEHAKSSRENMQTAIWVGLSFNELRNVLVKDFAKALAVRLKKDNWDVDIKPWENEPFAKYAGMVCRKSNWIKDVYVCIEAQTGGGHDYIIGIAANSDKIAAETKNQIFLALKNHFGNGTSNEWWAWYRNLSDDYRHFDKERTLMALYSQSEFFEDICKEIEEIGAVVDGCLTKKTV